MRRISWIGVGIMGKAMVRNLMKAGYEVHIYARHPEKVADVVSEGAVPHGSIAECVKASEVVITMVGFPKDVEEVYFAPGNILDSAAKGMTLIDMTTTSPTLAQRIYREGTAGACGCWMLLSPAGTAGPCWNAFHSGRRPIRQISTLASPFSRQWALTSPISVPQAAANTPKWPIRS